MAKLSLKIDPTFQITVNIPKAGAAPVQITLTCKHRTKAQLAAFAESRSGKSDADSIFDMATAWDLDDQFTKENIEDLCQKYIAAPIEIYRDYVAALVGEKTKN